jgi:hypothetical protein
MTGVLLFFGDQNRRVLDGNHYLTEKYANVVINLGSLINLKNKPDQKRYARRNWNCSTTLMANTRTHFIGPHLS